VRITIFDYGAGNLHSLEKAMAGAGIAVAIEADPLRCIDTDLLVLPGVGSFAQAASRLAPARAPLRDAILAGLPTIGICLGMQLLFTRSDESAGSDDYDGLDVLGGRVTRLNASRVPQIGWNSFEDVRDPLFENAGLDTGYYANSFVCRPKDETAVVAWSRHEDDRFPAMVRVRRAVGVQFHPEKSSAAGVRFLRAAVEELLT
jgi:glutamine amidotransferase